MDNNLITAKDEYVNFTNDLTRELDTYLIDENSDEYCKTYIYDNIHSGRWLIRFPGATRGYIETENNMIIMNIVLYKDSLDIYKEEAIQCLNKYIGKRLVFK